MGTWYIKSFFKCLVTFLPHVQAPEEQGAPLYTHLLAADELYLMAFCQPCLGLVLPRDYLAHRDLFWTQGTQVAPKTHSQPDFVQSPFLITTGWVPGRYKNHVTITFSRKMLRTSTIQTSRKENSMLWTGGQFGWGNKSFQILHVFDILLTPSLYLTGICVSRAQLLLINAQVQEVPLCTKIIQVFAQPWSLHRSCSTVHLLWMFFGLFIREKEHHSHISHSCLERFIL